MQTLLRFGIAATLLATTAITFHQRRVYPDPHFLCHSALTTLKRTATTPMKTAENGFTREDLKAKLFQGFADPIRIAILELLREREMAVGEIADAVGCSQPRISNHLACLRWCQFVQTRKERNQVIYSLRDDRIRQILELGDERLAANAEQISSCIRV